VRECGASLALSVADGQPQHVGGWGIYRRLPPGKGVHVWISLDFDMLWCPLAFALRHEIRGLMDFSPLVLSGFLFPGALVLGRGKAS